MWWRAQSRARVRTSADTPPLDALYALAAGKPAAGQSAGFHLVLAQSAHNEVLEAFVRTLLPMLGERGPALQQIDGYRAWE
jgi:DNA-binding FadR family transcriptional regulator